MWRKVLTPTLLVISIWIVGGGVTTFYIHWLAELHTRVLNENVGTIQAVADMQDSLLRLQALTASDGGSQLPGATERVEQLLSDFERGLTAADKTAMTSKEHVVVADLRREFSDYRAGLREWAKRQREVGTPPGSPNLQVSPSVDSLTSPLRRLRKSMSS